MQAALAIAPKRFLAGISALLLLLALAGCGGTGTTPSPTPTTGTGTPSATLRDPAHWGPIVGLHAGDNVERVSFGHLLGNASLQALVNVRVDGVGGDLCLYVYDQIDNTQPHLLFSMKGLVLGDARISPANTLLTAQAAGAAELSNAEMYGGGLVQDVFREFKWSASARTFTQVVYTGMFPDLTRWQAEADQAKVSAGQESWKLDVLKTAEQFVHAFLRWPLDSPAALMSGGGAQDGQAVVKVASPNPTRPTVSLTLQRFDEVTSNGLWEVTTVQGESWQKMTSPQSGATVTSPVIVTGTGRAFEANAGTVYAFDRLYVQIGKARADASIGMGFSPFTATLTFTSDFQGGAQEGLIAAYDDESGQGGPIATAVFIKVLLNA